MSAIVGEKTVEERAMVVIAGTLHLKSVSPESSMTDDLHVDVIDRGKLLFRLNEEFEITIPPDEAEKLQTVQTFVDYIKKHIKKQPA